MTCVCCCSTDVVEIRMRLGSQRVTMHSCLVCEQRWWDSDGESLGIGTVLDLVAAS